MNKSPEYTENLLNELIQHSKTIGLKTLFEIHSVTSNPFEIAVITSEMCSAMISSTFLALKKHKGEQAARLWFEIFISDLSKVIPAKFQIIEKSNS